MDFYTAAMWYTGTLVVGFIATQICVWFQEPVEEDALLIDVACQTSPIKKIRLTQYVVDENIDNDNMSTDSDSESISSYFITNS